MADIRDIISACQRMADKHVPRLIREFKGTEATREFVRLNHGPIPTPIYAIGEPGTGRQLSEETFADYDTALEAAGRIGGIVIRPKKAPANP